MHTDQTLPADQRKKLLVLQGQLFRSGLVLAQHDVRAGLQPKALLRSAFGDAVETGTEAARRLLSLQSLMDGRLSMLLPIAGKGLRLISRRGLLRPLVLAVAAGGLGYAGWLLWQKRRAAAAHTQDPQSDPTNDSAQ